MVAKAYTNSIGISLPVAFVGLIDEILKVNPDFKNRTGVIRYCVRKYYEDMVLGYGKQDRADKDGEL